MQYLSVNFASKPISSSEDMTSLLPYKKSQTNELDTPWHENNDGKGVEVNNLESDFLTSSSD